MRLFTMIPAFLLALLSQAVQQAEVHLGVSWEAVILAFIAAVPPTLLALAAWRASKKTGEDVASVHTVVNSNATLSAQHLKDARKEISDLRVWIAAQHKGTPLPGKAEPDAP